MNYKVDDGDYIPLPFLEIDNPTWAFEPVAGAVNTPNTGDRITT